MFQGLTNGKDHYQIPHIFFTSYLCSKVKHVVGGKSYLQFSLPLGNTTWRTHLPWLIFLGIRDLSGSNPIWKLSFLSFSYRKVRAWVFSPYFKEQASKIQAANMFFLSVLLPFRYYLLMCFFFLVRNYFLKLFVF